MFRGDEMIIRSKEHVKKLMCEFKNFSQKDMERNKWYLVFENKERNGVWTLMKYPDNSWTIHGKGEKYCDPDETNLTEEETIDFIWKNRKSINKTLKNK